MYAVAERLIECFGCFWGNRVIDWVWCKRGRRKQLYKYRITIICKAFDLRSKLFMNKFAHVIEPSHTAKSSPELHYITVMKIRVFNKFVTSKQLYLRIYKLMTIKYKRMILVADPPKGIQFGFFSLDLGRTRFCGAWTQKSWRHQITRSTLLTSTYMFIYYLF